MSYIRAQRIINGDVLTYRYWWGVKWIYRCTYLLHMFCI